MQTSKEAMRCQGGRQRDRQEGWQGERQAGRQQEKEG